jgi:hypothetical protein
MTKNTASEPYDYCLECSDEEKSSVTLTPGNNVINLFCFVTDLPAKKARVFVQKLVQTARYLNPVTIVWSARMKKKVL